ARARGYRIFAAVIGLVRLAISPRRGSAVRMSTNVLAGLFSLALSSLCFAAAEDPYAAARNDPLEPAFRLVREAVAKNEVPGAIALVARRGTILRHEAYGLSDIENQIPFTTNRLCWIASITKPVTVAA